jgi:hypothetical protein
MLIIILKIGLWVSLAIVSYEEIRNHLLVILMPQKYSRRTIGVLCQTIVLITLIGAIIATWGM